MKLDCPIRVRASAIELKNRVASRACGHRGATGFTRIEALVMLAAVLILTCVALPVLAHTKPRSHRVACLNNLRQIGVGWRTWANDHGDRFPWLAIAPADGGSTGGPLEAWYYFGLASNELATPKILVCPSDPLKRAASD